MRAGGGQKGDKRNRKLIIANTKFPAQNIDKEKPARYGNLAKYFLEDSIF
jgi:hypothetical protein